MHFSLKQRAILALSVVAFSYALLSVVIRLMNAGFGPFTQVYLRIGLGCILTAVVFYRKIHFAKFFTVSKKDWFFLLLMGIVGYGLSVDLATLGTLQTKLLDVSVMASTTPFFIFLFSVIVLRKAFHPFLLFFVVMAFYGVCVLATKSLMPTLTNFGTGDFYVLLFAVGLGFYIYGRKMLSSRLNTYEIAVITMAIASVVSYFVALGFKESVSIAGFFNPSAFFGLILGGVLNLVATTLETFAFKHLNAVAGSQLLLLENIFAPVFGFVFYKEYLLPVEFFGALLVIAGVWLYIRYGED